MEGTLESEGGQARQLLTVIDTLGMRQLQTIQLQDQRSNPFRLQDAAVTQLAKVLNARPLVQRQMSALEPGAYDFYLQARGYLQRNDLPQSLECAVTPLKRAIELDPKFALAHWALGELTTLRPNSSSVRAPAPAIGYEMDLRRRIEPFDSAHDLEVRNGMASPTPGAGP